MENLNSKDLLGRREQERRWRRQYILNVAERLFAQKGYHQTTMAEIAKASEFGMATIYQFFKSKDKIYLTLLHEKIDLLLKLIKQAIEEAQTPLEKIKAIIQVKLKFFQKNRDFFRIYALHRQNIVVLLREELGKKIDEKYQEGLSTLAQIIEEGISQGEFKRFPPKEMAVLISGMIQALIHEWIKSEKEVQLTSKLPIILDFLFYGLKGKI